MQPVRVQRITTSAACTLLLAAATVPGASGAELQQPTPLYAVGLPTDASPNASNPPGSLTTCPALPPPTGGVLPGRLVIRDTPRPDVGPYTVSLPGYATDPTSSAADSYRPYLIASSPGNALRIDVVNQLSPDSALGGTANLHTHGLVTSPRPCTPLGDYIFVADQPDTTVSYRVDIPPTLPGYMVGNQPAPVPYPSGLQWFHAHLHEKTTDDLLAGQAGMLYVGDLRADLLAAPGIDAASADALSNADVLYMGLRDIQLAVPRGAAPDQAPPGQTAQWLHGSDYNPDACLTYANPPIPVPGTFAGPGYCGHRGATVDGKADGSLDTVWLHTVNGQANPTVTMTPGRNQIWRIANLSPDETYLLELADSATGQPQSMTVLALDGLAAGTAVTQGSGLKIGVPLSRALLMPASRAEVLVVNAGGAQGRQLTLRTLGITTGAAGSHWPRIDLAQISMPPGPEPAAPGPSASGSNMASVQPGASPPSVAPANQISAAAPPNCITLPTGRVTRRRITFDENPDGSSFRIGSEVVDVNGVPIDARHTIAPQPFPLDAALNPGAVPHICVRLGTQEVWEVVNYTGELHNVHLHELKFRLSQQSDSGVPPRLQAFQDPSGLIAQYQPQAANAPAVNNVDAFHDTFPLPPYGGRIFITAPFFAPQQVGNFVYHCHILTHEDKGMMAVMQVYDPAQLASADPNGFGTLASGTICGLQPPRRTVSWGEKALDAVRSMGQSAFSATGLLGGVAASWSGLGVQ